MPRVSMVSFLIFTALVLASFAAAQAPPSETDVEPETSDFVIGVEDVLEIVTRGEDEFSRTVTVRPDGKITLPLVNDVQVAGLTTEQARHKIATLLRDKKLVRDPYVTVIVNELNNFRVFFLGEIRNQGPQNFYRPTRLLQGLAAAGGLTEFSKKEVTVLREVDGGQVQLEINVKKIWSGDGIEENIYLKPGDTVLVR